MVIVIGRHFHRITVVIRLALLLLGVILMFIREYVFKYLFVLWRSIKMRKRNMFAKARLTKIIKFVETN